MTASAEANPYAPPKAEVSDATEELVVEQATRGSRLGAASLDALVGIVVGLPVLYAVIPAAIQGRGNPGEMSSLIMASIIGGAAALSGVLAIAWMVITFILVKRNSQTIGKKFVGIKVARSDGSHASLARIFWLRNVVNALPSLIPVVGNFYSLVDHLFIFGGKRQCLHDKIADTIVVKV
ncbi:MAG: RDD family protein [Steroidobacteraceae bacterium]